MFLKPAALSLPCLLPQRPSFSMWEQLPGRPLCLCPCPCHCCSFITQQLGSPLEKGSGIITFFSPFSRDLTSRKSQVLTMNSHALQSRCRCLSDLSPTNLALPVLLFPKHLSQAPTLRVYDLLHRLSETSQYSHSQKPSDSLK